MIRKKSCYIINPDSKDIMFGLGSSGISFDPATDIPDLKGKVIFVTGGMFSNGMVVTQK